MTAIQSLLQTMRRAIKSEAARSEILSLPEVERKLLGQNLGIGSQEIAQLIPGNLGPDKQLPSRLRIAGLDPEEVSAKYGAVKQDMERVCSLCHHQRRCAKDFRTGKEHHIEDYCPNSSTIDALAADRSLNNQIQAVDH